MSSAETILVVPCYNEAERLDVRAFASFAKSEPRTSLLFVDDGSTDGTYALLEQLREIRPQQISLLKLPRNCGKAEAVRRGVLAALAKSPKFVGYFDADLATPLDASSKLRDVLAKNPAVEIAFGSRVRLLGRNINRRPARHYLGRAFATAASWTLGLPVYDTQCGAKLFRASPRTTELFAERFNSRWIFDVELLARLCAAVGEDVRACLYEQPLDEWIEVAGSRVRPRDFAKAAIELWKIHRWLRHAEKLRRPTVATPEPVIVSLPAAEASSSTSKTLQRRKAA